MSELVVVRHGRTEANARGLLLGRLDVPLDPTGEAQARAVAAAVLGAAAAAGEEVAAVVSSPLLRTRQTAAAFGLPVELDERFIELDYGEFDGRPLGDVPAEVWRSWRTDPTFCPPGGETLAQVSERVASACEDWAERAGAGTVVVVTHVSPLKAAVAWALGVGDETSWRTRVDPASISRVGVGPGGPVLRSFNETGHLVDVGD
jgi:broad specificity phosphatase PhoE